MVLIACAIFSMSIKGEIARSELHKRADVISANLYETDLIVKTAIDYNDISAFACKSLNFYTDKSEIQNLLVRMAKGDYVETSFVCDYAGKGYDHRGEVIDIGSEQTFGEALDSFSKGGSGLLLVRKSSTFSDRSIMVINQIFFRDQVKGFLITILHVGDLADRIFAGPQDAEKMALVSLTGDVLATPDKNVYLDSNFWDNVPSTLPVDTIKLNISQKTIYLNEVDGYGYVISIPSKVTVGAAVVLLSYDKLKDIIRFQMMRYYIFTIVLVGIVFVFSAFMIGSYFIKLHISKTRIKKTEGNAQRDRVTGLLNGIGVAAEMRKYIENSSIKRGLMFSLFVDEFKSLREEKGDEEADRQIFAFANKLAQRYRFTDVIGKLSDGEYVIFMKDVDQEKDIRKQVDELQIFLYDIKNDVAHGERPLNVSAGGSLFPKDGSNADELLSAARAAMEKGRADGSGRISFYR